MLKISAAIPTLQVTYLWMGTRGREPRRIGAGGGREARGDEAGCGSHVRVGDGRRMRYIKFFNDFLVPF